MPMVSLSGYVFEKRERTDGGSDVGSCLSCLFRMSGLDIRGATEKGICGCNITTEYPHCIKRVGVGYNSIAGYQSISRFESDYAAIRSRQSNTTAGISTNRPIVSVF